MLTSAHIKNFRSCKDVKLDNLGHMVALVGRNGAGKTTILRALEWVASRAVTNDGIDRLIHPDSELAALTPFVAIELTARARVYRFEFGRTAANGSTTNKESLSVKHASDDSWTSIFARNSNLIELADRPPVDLAPGSPALPGLASLLGRSDPLRAHIEAASDALQRVRYYPGQMVFYPEDAVSDEPRGPIHEAEYDRWVAAHGFGPKRTSLLFRLLFAQRNRPTIFAEIKQLMGPSGLGLLDDIRIATLGDTAPSESRRARQNRYFHVRFAPAAANVEVSLDQLSGGTRHALYLLLGLLYDDNSTMLIEQPEDGIHPGLLTKLIDLLRVNTDPAQIILTSHSPVVLSSLQAGDIRLVDIHDDSTTVRPLSPAEIQRAQEYMQRDGTLAEFLELIQED